MIPPSRYRALRALLSLLVVAVGLSSCNSAGEPSVAQVKAVEIATGLSKPWSLAFLPNGQMLITERTGSLRVVDGQGNISPRIGGVPPVATDGQGGLLDVRLSPDFADNPQIYFSFSERASEGGSRTAVARADFSETAISNVEIIFRQQPAINSGVHFGSRLVFDNAGDLFVTLGDRGNPDGAQLTGSSHGKVVRIRRDGTTPDDNPFVGNNNFAPELFSIGHRNPQGAALHPDTGEVWIHEHGPRGGDEVNRLVAGKNYGWPRITYGLDYNTGEPVGEGTTETGVEPPAYYWVPISIAPAGMVFYTGNQIPALTGKLLLGAMAARALVSLTVVDGQVTDEQQLLTDLGERIRDVRQGPDGYPYVLTDSGKLLRIEPI